MRLTEKGQVTIPLPIRKALGLGPSSEVEFSLETDRAYITSDGRQFVQEFMKCRLLGRGRTPASR